MEGVVARDHRKGWHQEKVHDVPEHDCDQRLHEVHEH